MEKGLVMKFGGASVASAKHFLHIARLVKKRCQFFSRIVVVVSAMGDTTDHLLDLAKEVSESPSDREIDMLVSAGERVSIALLAMALEGEGVPAISFTGSQSGILTTDAHTEARLINVRPLRLEKELQNKQVVIVAGFQGMSLSGQITTLGRGGSDTSAVALGVGLEGISHVEFYKDVDGIYDGDPKQNKVVSRFNRLSYNQTLSVIQDAKHAVLAPRCVELAEKNGLPLRVLSYRCMHPEDDEEGTWIASETCVRERVKYFEQDLSVCE